MLEFSCRRQDAVLKSPDAPVVMADSFLQRTSQVFDIFAKRRNSPKQVAGLFGNRLGIPGKGLLLPSERNRFQQSDQCCRCAQQNLFLDSLFQEAQISLDGGREKRFSWYEHDHEVGAVRQGVPVLFRFQLVDVVAQLGRMVPDMVLAHYFVRFFIALR